MKNLIGFLLFVMISVTACASGSVEQIPVTDDNSSATRENVLVAYFSATNTTKGIAESIASTLKANLYRIEPESPYIAEDLDYGDNDSRSSIEMNDKSSRPAILGSVENMEQYDVIFLGYPIWWGEAPRIVSTFIESYDFSGKTIVPFCTSGGSGFGSSGRYLKELASDAIWIEGRRFSGNASDDTIVQWINTLNLNI